MNWPLRTAALAAALVAVTLPMKFAVDRAPADMASEIRTKAAVLRAFLGRSGARDLTPVPANPNAPWLTAWRFRDSSCLATAVPQYADEANLELLRRLRGPRTAVAFVYRGAVRADYPRLPFFADTVLTHALWSVHPSRWRIPMLVIVFHDGDCRSMLAWDWSRL